MSFKCNRIFRHSRFWLAFGLAAQIWFATAASAETDQDSDGFQIGGSCAALAYASTSNLRALIAGGYADDFHAFCFPEEPAECSDYTSFLKGVGRLSTGEDGYHCSLQLQ